MTAYYNEIDPYPAAWLVRLADADHIAPGRVDARSIAEVKPADLDGATQAHFFAGIGVWSYALRLAGWPDSEPVWTGSCPCQPFSAAGKRRGFDDERHLWPEWFRLIRQCRPPVVFGEQVARGGGLRWFDLVSADMEAEGYAVGAANLAAPGAGAFHVRERLFFVAVADRERRHGIDALLPARDEPRTDCLEASRGGAHGAVADGARHGRRQGSQDGVRGDRRGDEGAGAGPELRGGARGVAHHLLNGLEGQCEGRAASRATHRGRAFDPWRDAEWLPCLDGKSRPIEPGTFPLAHRTSARVGRLRAYGNAIVPQVAATFIKAAREVIHEHR